MPKYTDEQIKKALECCNNGSCRECPFRCGSAACVTNLLRAVLDLDNRQEAEIAELKSDLTLLKNDYEQCKSVYDEEKAKVAKLNDKLITAYKLLKTAKFEAIKEFSERLKEQKLFIVGGSMVFVSDIDSLAKEMVGEGE